MKLKKKKEKKFQLDLTGILTQKGVAGSPDQR